MDSRLKDLALGPNREVHTWPQYHANGYRFHTLDYGSNKVTMNSGVCVKGTNYNDPDSDYFGMLVEVIELEYHNPSTKRTRIVLFKCDWFDPQKGHGWKVHNEYGLVEIHKKRRFQKYEPFILAQQAQQVYYVEYPGKKTKYQMSERANWLAVCKVKARSMIESSNVAYQEDEVRHSSNVIIDDNIEELDLETNDYEKILCNDMVKGDENMGANDYEADYETEFKSSSEDDMPENMENIDFSESTKDDDNDADDTEEQSD